MLLPCLYHQHNLFLYNFSNHQHPYPTFYNTPEYAVNTCIITYTNTHTHTHTFLVFWINMFYNDLQTSCSLHWSQQLLNFCSLQRSQASSCIFCGAKDFCPRAYGFTFSSKLRRAACSSWCSRPLSIKDPGFYWATSSGNVDVGRLSISLFILFRGYK